VITTDERGVASRQAERVTPKLATRPGGVLNEAYQR
jgi:hypothetical protein